MWFLTIWIPHHESIVILFTGSTSVKTKIETLPRCSNNFFQLFQFFIVRIWCLIDAENCVPWRSFLVKQAIVLPFYLIIVKKSRQFLRFWGYNNQRIKIMNFKSVGKFSATYLLELWFEIYLPIMTNHCLLQISKKKQKKLTISFETFKFRGAWSYEKSANECEFWFFCEISSTRSFHYTESTEKLFNI